MRKRATVLVVEDNPSVRRALVDLLELEGLAAVQAANGIQALRCLEDGLAPAVILLDLELPFMSGWHLHRQLRQDPAYAGISVVILTAHDVASAGIAGADAVLQKPMTPQCLLDTLTHCIAARRQPDRPPRLPVGGRS